METALLTEEGEQLPEGFHLVEYAKEDDPNQPLYEMTDEEFDTYLADLYAEKHGG